MPKNRWKCLLAPAMGLVVLPSLACGAPSDTWGDKPWPKIVDIVLTASVTIRSERNVDYAYALLNSTANFLPIENFFIDLRLYPSQHPFSMSDVTVGHTARQHIDTINAAELLDVIQVASPAGWATETKNAGAWGVPALDVSQMLKPGHVASGFWIEAEQPVGIREFVAEAYSWDFVNNPEGYQFKGSIDELTAAVNRGIEFVGKTIAPVTPPEPFSASIWATHIQGLARQARGLGWVKTDAQMEHLIPLIAQLDAADINGLNTAADAIAFYVQSEVAAGRMTSEADALVRVNALYLLSRVRKDPLLLGQK